MKNYKLIISGFLSAAVVALPLSIQATDAKADVKPYPLSKCLISGDKLGGDMGKPVVLVNDKQELKFCCNDCVKEYKKDPAAYLQKLDKASQQAAKDHPYPLDKCLISGEKLGGDMGKPFVFVYDDREIKLCCSSCLADFKKNSAKYLKQLDQAKAGK